VSLYRKLGFVQEGVARQQMFWQGKYLDMIQFAMLEDEFQQLKTANGR
jgi:RimJ/RimL family protein N-acetyltransferase